MAWAQCGCGVIGNVWALIAQDGEQTSPLCQRCRAIMRTRWLDEGRRNIRVVS